MSLIVSGIDKDKIVLISDKNDDGILHQGSYLTIVDPDSMNTIKKFILRVENTFQNNPYTPSPLIIDMDLSPLKQDQKCQNIVYATRIIEVPERDDGRSSYIKPQIKARKSNQEEINLAFGNSKGIPIFPATAFVRNIQHLRDDNKKFMQVNIPDDVFFHQMIIAGSTGSGKTVAMKYLSQYFIEEFGGAVLAVNVKEEDLLTMDCPSNTNNEVIKQEWKDLNLEPHGIDTFKIYYPGNQDIRYSEDVNIKDCEKITLLTNHIDPETLTGLIQNISDRGADQLPSIFRYWQKRVRSKNDTINDFINYFGAHSVNRTFNTLNNRDEEQNIIMFPGTFQNVLNALTYSSEFFDIKGAKEITAQDILQNGKMSVIDVTAKYGFAFGSVLLRDLLDKIYEAKSTKTSNVPILIIIDEVHEFYSDTRSREALQTLGAICRKGRGLEIGVIFASQNPDDMPSGINNVVNTKIYFKTSLSNMKSLGINMSGIDPEAFGKGYAVASIYGLSQLKFLKFPMALAGVNDARNKAR